MPNPLHETGGLFMFQLLGVQLWKLRMDNLFTESIVPLGEFELFYLGSRLAELVLFK